MGYLKYWNNSLCVSLLPLLINQSVSTDVLLSRLDSTKYLQHFERTKKQDMYLSCRIDVMLSMERASAPVPVNKF